MGLVLTGLAVGLGLSLVVSRTLASLLLGVNASDPVSFAGAAVLLTAVAFFGSYLPAPRERLDPLLAIESLMRFTLSWLPIRGPSQHKGHKGHKGDQPLSFIVLGVLCVPSTPHRRRNRFKCRHPP
jgi:hypothetical protein